MCGVKFPAIINCVTLVILLVINEAGSSQPWLTWVQTSRRWTRLRAIMEPTTWIASTDKPYHLLLSSESAVDKAWFAVGYDQSTQYIYWSDSVDRKIYRQKQNDSLITRKENSIEMVYEGTSTQVTGLANDWYSNGVYWTDAGTKTISMTRANKGRQDLSKVLINTNLDQPSGIVVHPARGLMYFADKGSSSDGWKIEEATLLGQNRKVLLSQRVGSDIGIPECLSYDYSSDTLYWVDSQSYVVRSYDVRNAGPVQTVVTGLAPGISWPGITNYQDYIFLSAQADLQIHAYSKSNGQLVKSYTIDATPNHLIITGQVSKPPSECDTLDCEHFCVSLGNGKGQCECADGYYIELDGKSCLSVDPQYIYSRGRSIWHADVTIAQNAPRTINMMTTPFITDVVKVQALAFHYKKNYLYLNDIETDVLYRNVPLESTKEEITVNTRHVEGMTVNWITNTLYWADNTLEHIMCSQLDGRYHKILVENTQGIRGLAVDAIHQMMFWIIDGQTRSIMSSNLDGSNVRAVFTQGMNQPQGITVDPRTSKVYWTDRSENRVYSMDLQGNGKVDVITGTPNPYEQFYGVTMFKDYVTYSMGELDLQFGIQNQQNPDYFAYDQLTDIRPTMRPNYGPPETSYSYDVITFDSYMQPSTDKMNVCENSNCQQLCFSVSSAQKCECAIGFTLNEDGTSCDSVVLESEFLTFVDPYHKQIYQQGKFTDIPQGVLLPNMEFPVSVDVDSTGTLYWIDRKAGVIQSSPILTKEQLGQSAKLLRQIPQGFRPEKLVVDEAGGHVYYTDSQVGSIYRMKLDGSNHESIINGVGRCVGLVVDSPNNRLYWSELSARLMTAKLDGSEAEALSQDRGQLGDNPRALAYWPDDSMLYFADELTGTISSMNTTTRQMSFLFRDARYWIIALTADANYLYFTTQNEKGIYRIRRGGGDTEPTKLGAEIYARITDIKTFEGFIKPPVPVTAVDDGFPWMYAAIGGGAGILLLFAICMIGLCAARRKRKTPPSSASPIIGSDTSATYENVDQDYINVANGTANGVPNGSANGSANGGTVPNGIPPPPDAPPPPVPPTDTHARVHFTNNGFTPDENGHGTSNMGPAVAVLPAVAAAKPLKKSRYKKKENPSKHEPDPNEFKLGEDQKVATVIQRLAHRLRNRLSSVRFHGGPLPPGGDQENHVPEYDPEAADAQPGGPERSRGPGPKKNITYPPQLHRPPRGYAPASHAVPVGALKNSWGRGKHNKVFGNKV